MDADLLTATRLCLRCGKPRPLTEFLPAAWCPAGQLHWCAQCRPMQHHEPKPRAPRPVSKTCKVCGEDKPLGLFPRDAHRRDGHKGECSKCNAAQKRALYAAKKQAQPPTKRRPAAKRVVVDGVPSKVCSTCHTLKPLTDYVRDRRRKIDGRYFECAQCKYQREKRRRMATAQSCADDTPVSHAQPARQTWVRSEAEAERTDAVRSKWVLYAQVLLGVQDRQDREQWECWLVETVPADDASREDHQAWIKQVKELIR